MFLFWFHSRSSFVVSEFELQKITRLDFKQHLDVLKNRNCNLAVFQRWLSDLRQVSWHYFFFVRVCTHVWHAQPFLKQFLIISSFDHLCIDLNCIIFVYLETYNLCCNLMSKWKLFGENYGENCVLMIKN